MDEIKQKNDYFRPIYNKSYRLAAAVFVISNTINEDEELKTRIKKLSLELVSMSVNLKNTDLLNTRKLMVEIEKKSLELISMLDIARLSGLVSEMNGNLVKEEFNSFIFDLNKLPEKFETEKNTSVKNVFSEPSFTIAPDNPEKVYILEKTKTFSSHKEDGSENRKGNDNGHKRKDLRKNTILSFVKGHNDVSIKDIVPNIVGCSEKTIQRELMGLISEGKIKRVGERRWSRYSATNV